MDLQYPPQLAPSLNTISHYFCYCFSVPNRLTNNDLSILTWRGLGPRTMLCCVKGSITFCWRSESEDPDPKATKQCIAWIRILLFLQCKVINTVARSGNLCYIHKRIDFFLPILGKELNKCYSISDIYMYVLVPLNMHWSCNLRREF